MNEKPTNRASHEDGITDANSLPGENQSRAVRRRLRLGRSSSVSVEFAAAATPFTVSTRTCVGCTPCPAAATTVGGGRQRYGCGSGDALVDALKDANDKTKLTLIYANVNYEDILLKKEIDALAEAHPDQFSVYYVLNNPPEGWLGGVGFVTKDMIEKHMPPSSMKDAKVLMCGPPPMLTAMK